MGRKTKQENIGLGCSIRQVQQTLAHGFRPAATGDRFYVCKKGKFPTTIGLRYPTKAGEQKNSEPWELFHPFQVPFLPVLQYVCKNSKVP